MTHTQGTHIGILGGTFDPLHNGHLAIARAARDACALDTVLFIPTGDPAFKQGTVHASAHNRLAMCRLATKDGPTFQVSDIEVNRPGITYTVDTLRELHKQYPSDTHLSFIIGADSATSLPSWREADQLAHLAHYIIVSRPGTMLTRDKLDALREQGFNITLLEGIDEHVSSSEVRARIARGESIDHLIPPTVANYIQVHQLYR